MTSKPLPQEEYPLHWLVWHNNYEQLKKELSKNVHNIEEYDPRGRTPLHLAVTLGYLESARVLLHHGANAIAENSGCWTVLHEATSTGDPELVQLALKYRDLQRYNKRSGGVPHLLEKLKESPDFYVEMKWEFTSWVPLVSRICPSDVYRVWKSGSNVRIDTTLLGFDNMKWQRGNRSYIFKGKADTASVIEVDHDNQEVYCETMQLPLSELDINILEPSEEDVAARLTSAIMTTYIDTDKIAFERNKSGIWGWRSDKTEAVNSYDCKVFSASNVELLTKSRMEHLTEQDKEKMKKVTKTPLESFLGVAEEHSKARGASNGDVSSVSYNPCCIRPEDYFDKNIDLGDHDIGRPIEQTTKAQRFKANLWLCETYPLSLPEQVIPILDLMAASNAHFRKLRDFVTLQIPAGFPVKIEIPLFHVLNARITFGNIFATEGPASGVTSVDGDRLSCIIDDSIFEPPASYIKLGDGQHDRLGLRADDEQLLQFAIQQSLMEAGTENDQVTFWEALNKSRPPLGNTTAEEERLLQRALAESMMYNAADDQQTNIPLNSNKDASPSSELSEDVLQMRLALELSQKEKEEEEQRQKDEEEELERILKLSLTDK